MSGKQTLYFFSAENILYHYVVQGARLGCDQCPPTLANPIGPQLLVTSQTIKHQNGELLANDTDHQSIINILPFVFCLNRGICIPSVPDPWKFTKQDVLSIKRPTLLCDENNYTNSSRCFCEYGKGWIYAVSCGQHPANDAEKRDEMIEEVYNMLKEAYEEANGNSDWSIADVSDEDIRQAATDYVDASIEFSKYTTNTDGQIHISELSPSLQGQLCQLGGQAPSEFSNQIDLDKDGNPIYDVSQLMEDSQILYMKREGVECTPSYGMIDQKLLLELAMKKVIKPSGLYTAVAAAIIIGALAAAVTAPVWVPAAVGFLETTSLAGLTITVGSGTITITPAMMKVLQDTGIDGLLSTFENTKPVYNALGNLCGLEIDGKQIALDTVSSLVWNGGWSVADGNSLFSYNSTANGLTNIPNLDDPDFIGPLAPSVKSDNLNFIDFPDNDAKLKHIFRSKEGHIDDTPSNRKLLTNVANNPDNYLGCDSRGNDWYAKINSDGSQTWIESRNNIITNAGINSIPKPYDPETGLKQNITKRPKKNKK